MVEKNKLFKILLVLVLIFSFSIPTSYANGLNSSGKIDAVIVATKEGGKIVVSIDEYIEMYDTRMGELYKFLSKGLTKMFVYGVVSGEKYIDINEYIEEYDTNNSNIKNALNSAETLSNIEVNTFQKAIITNLSTGQYELTPIGNVEEFRVIEIY